MIFVNQPYIITVNESGQIGSKIELFIWNDGETEPTNPTYTFTKDAPSPTNLANYYNISPFIAEFINKDLFFATALAELTTLFSNVKVKRYKNVGGTYTLVETITDKAMFGSIPNGTNDIVFNYKTLLTDNTTYYYEEFAFQPVTFQVPSGTSGVWKVRVVDAFSNLVLFDEIIDVGKIYALNVLEYGTNVKFLLIVGSTISRSLTFIKQDECVYTPMPLIYLNDYGTYVVDTFFKANKQEFSIENSEFKSFQVPSSSFPYTSLEGKQRQTFNTIGREKITINSGWVNESFKESIKQIMLSEYIYLWNGSVGVPVNIETKNILIQSNINNDLINYQLTFNYSNDYSR
jgi:hypothetical protein